MSDIMLLESYSRFQPDISNRPVKSWPTMYDLPSENPEDLGLPDIFHDQQPQLLKETFQSPVYASDDVFVASDLNLYYDFKHPKWYKRPDWFAVVGVPKLYEDRDLRYSYVIWDEGVIPLIAVELLSPGTEDEDLGRKLPPKKGKAPKKMPQKWEIYEKILKIPYYVTFDRRVNEARFFKLMPNGYVELPSTTEIFWISEVQLGLGVWKGVYDGFERQWLRWSDANGLWLPTLEEQATAERQRTVKAEKRAVQAEKQAVKAEKRAAQAEQQATAERQRAVQAEQQAAAERQRVQQLEAQLRAFGIDLDHT